MWSSKDLAWTFDPDYCGQPTWWHEDCPTPTVLDDGAQIGGMAHEERVHGHLVAILCDDCGDRPDRRRMADGCNGS